MMNRWFLLGMVPLLSAAMPAAATPDRFAGTRLEPFAVAAARIQALENGRVSAVFWDLASATGSDFQTLAHAGFNEVIVDGHHFGEGHLPLEKVADQVAAAARAGITSFKFVRGSPDWVGAEGVSARKKIAGLADRVQQLKGLLQARGDPQAAAILKGVLVNVEPYAQRGWNYDLSGYVRLHDDLQKIAESRGLSYETFDAFWLGEPVHESGNAMTGYRVDPARTSYVMCYRCDGYDAFKIAGFFATRVPHLAGFDLVSGDPVGFKDRPKDLAQTVADYVDLTLSVRRERPAFLGIFVNASRVADLISFISRSSSRG